MEQKRKGQVQVTDDLVLQFARRAAKCKRCHGCGKQFGHCCPHCESQSLDGIRGRTGNGVSSDVDMDTLKTMLEELVCLA